MQFMTPAEDPKPNLAMALFALGHADASLSFISLLCDDVAAKVSSTLALRLLGSLWSQYRIDCRINHGRTLLSIDNGYELRLFTTLIDELSSWPPLRAASSLIRAHAPALSASERRQYDDEIDGKREIIAEVCDQIGRLPAEIDPIQRAALLMDRCQKLEEQEELGVCWALNLTAANRLNMLGGSKVSPPFPALFSREMLRFDRSKAWRNQALCSALADSVHEISANAFESVHASNSFRAAFPDLRRNSRLIFAHSYLSGIGVLSPTLLSKLVGCTEPGARKMLRQLANAGLARVKPPSPSFESVRNFRLGRSSAAWLSSFSVLPSHPFDVVSDD